METTYLYAAITFECDLELYRNINISFYLEGERWECCNWIFFSYNFNCNISHYLNLSWCYVSFLVVRLSLLYKFSLIKFKIVKKSCLLTDVNYWLFRGCSDLATVFTNSTLIAPLPKKKITVENVCEICRSKHADRRVL